MPEILAAIDIGTNSVHMVVARMRDTGFEVLTKHKEMVRLGSGEGDMKQLEPAAIERGVAALKRCRSIADGQDAEIFAVATSAVREAKNAREFIDRARDSAGVEVNVISGVEEARLIQLGVLQALPVFDEHLVLVDVGGGSTEILFGHRAEVDYVRSLKLGSIRMTRRFFPDGVVAKGSVERCRKFIAARLASVAHEGVDLEQSVAIASSGTAESLALMAYERKHDERPKSTNGLEMSTKSLTKLIGELASAETTEERLLLPGIDRDRADIILGGALVLEGVAKALNISKMTISEYALREGALLDAAARRRDSALNRLSDLRRSSVLHLLEVCDDDVEHSKQVASLSMQLYEQLGDRLGLGPADQELLEAAALLSNVGLLVSHSAHHKHSYYVIRHSENLSGFTDNETEVIAQVARYHRKAHPSQKHEPFAVLTEGDQERVTAMAALLRVAIGLDRNHDGAVKSVAVDLRKDEVTITAKGIGDPADLGVELYAAEIRSDLLKSILHCDLNFVAS